MAETLPATLREAQVKVEKRVKQYIDVRDALKKLDEEHEERRKPFVELQNMLTGWMQNFLEAAGAENIKTSEGTCYMSTRYSASLADPEAFMKFVIDNQMYDLLDRKANSTAVRAYVEEKGAEPPGAKLSAITTIGVRRASGK